MIEFASQHLDRVGPDDIPKAFWFVLLSYVEKFLKIKAKNVGIALATARLFNADIRKFCNKLTDKLKRLWYIKEIQEDAVVTAIHDQIHAGLDVITDGEQTRFDFNLSFYGYLKGIRQNNEVPRKWGPPAHDQRGKHAIVDTLSAPRRIRRGRRILNDSKD